MACGGPSGAEAMEVDGTERQKTVFLFADSQARDLVPDGGFADLFVKRGGKHYIPRTGGLHREFPVTLAENVRFRMLSLGGWDPAEEDITSPGLRNKIVAACHGIDLSEFTDVWVLGGLNHARGNVGLVPDFKQCKTMAYESAIGLANTICALGALFPNAAKVFLGAGRLREKPRVSKENKEALEVANLRLELVEVVLDVVFARSLESHDSGKFRVADCFDGWDDLCVLDLHGHWSQRGNAIFVANLRVGPGLGVIV